MTTAEVFAPAKINLTLHVTGRRTDGYHLLDSLVVFADVGDTIRVAPSDTLSLTIDGPEAAGLQVDDDNNLVLRAARFLSRDHGAAITLAKRLPVASGIGGGSADAAATLRALARLWDMPVPAPETATSLGADVPVCLTGHSTRMRGIGDDLTAVPDLPKLDILLVNPRVSVSTPDIFSALNSRTNPAMPDRLPAWKDAKDLASWLATQRNDLTAPAIQMQPAIATVLDALHSTDCLAHGMSGSGATCYALFPPNAAEAARAQLSAAHPGWWCEAATLL